MEFFLRTEGGIPTFVDRVEVEGCEAISHTARAILVRVPGLEDPVWFPQSQVDDDSEVYISGTSGTLVISDWIAHEKGLA